LNGPAGLLDTTVKPFICQSAGAPLSFCHRMSLRPLALKSSGVSTLKIAVVTSASEDVKASKANAMWSSVSRAPWKCSVAAPPGSVNSTPILSPCASNRCPWAAR
jgi:hypothetical protein